MKIGLKSVLWGTHAIWYHGFTVLAAWLYLYRRWPSAIELFAIFAHDIGYRECADLDGPEGLLHPIEGAKLTGRFARWWTGRPEAFQEGFNLAALHSSAFAKLGGVSPSKLCAPDKLSILFDPWLFYWFRASLTGELAEYMRQGPAGLTPKQWYRWLQNKFRKQFLL